MRTAEEYRALAAEAEATANDPRESDQARHDHLVLADAWHYCAKVSAWLAGYPSEKGPGPARAAAHAGAALVIVGALGFFLLPNLIRSRKAIYGTVRAVGSRVKRGLELLTR
jgi:hypothetical protein